MKYRRSCHFIYLAFDDITTVIFTIITGLRTLFFQWQPGFLQWTGNFSCSVYTIFPTFWSRQEAKVLRGNLPAANFTGELELKMVPLQVSNQTTLVLELLLTIRIFTLKPGHVHMLSFCVTFQGIFAEHLSVLVIRSGHWLIFCFFTKRRHWFSWRVNPWLLIGEDIVLFCSPSNSLVLVSDSWRSFWANTVPFSFTSTFSLLPELERYKDSTRCLQLSVAGPKSTIKNNWRKHWLPVCKNPQFLVFYTFYWL